MFQWFHDHLRSQIRLGWSLPDRSVLSDQGSEIHAFCHANGMVQFLCHRPLIEAVNANRSLGFIAARTVGKNHRDHHRAIVQSWCWAKVMSDRRSPRHDWFLLNRPETTRQRNHSCDDPTYVCNFFIKLNQIVM
jgi:hypothetical protein